MATKRTQVKATTTDVTEEPASRPRITRIGRDQVLNAGSTAVPIHDSLNRYASGASKYSDYDASAGGIESNLLVHNVKKPEPKDIWQKYIAWSVLGGLIPIPFVDIGAIALSNYFMIEEIANYYHQDFDSTKTKAIIAAVIGGVLPQSLTAGIPGAVIRMIPVVGPWVSFLVEPGFAALVTYVVAKLAISGYESGGDLGRVNKDYVLHYIQRVKDYGYDEGYADSETRSMVA